jgi:hypothetical protein
MPVGAADSRAGFRSWTVLRESATEIASVKPIPTFDDSLLAQSIFDNSLEAI